MKRLIIYGLFVIIGLSCAPIAQFAATPIPLDNLENIALHKAATASSYWYHDPKLFFPPESVVDGRTGEANCTDIPEGGQTYWLLAEKQTGWVQVDLGGEYLLVEIRWLNTHNGTCQDRATTKYHISVSTSSDFKSGEKQITKGAMEFTVPSAFREIILKTPIQGRYVRFYVDDYYMNGGGLNELEVYGVPV